MTSYDLYWRAGPFPTQILAFPNEKRAGMKSSKFPPNSLCSRGGAHVSEKCDFSNGYMQKTNESQKR